MCIMKNVGFIRVDRMCCVRFENGPLVKWLRHRPFTAVSRVRIPYGSSFIRQTLKIAISLNCREIAFCLIYLINAGLAQLTEQATYFIRVSYYVQACKECNFTGTTCNTTSIVFTGITSTESTTSNPEAFTSSNKL